MPQRRTLFAQILGNVPAAEESDQPTPPVPASLPPLPGNTRKKSRKLNKAVDPEYIKMTAYIPRDLHFQIKTAMAADRETDQSAYIERWLRESLERHLSAKASKGHSVIES